MYSIRYFKASLFSLDSNAMTISLPSQKLTAMLRTTRHLAEKTQTSLREISQVLGIMVATPSYQPHYTTDTWRGQNHTTSVVVYLSMTQSHSTRHPVRLKVVDSSGHILQWLALTNITLEFDRCIQTRLGCQPPWDKHRGTMDSQRTVKTYKLLGNESSFLVLQFFCTGRSPENS